MNIFYTYISRADLEHGLSVNTKFNKGRWQWKSLCENIKVFTLQCTVTGHAKQSIFVSKCA